MRHKKEVRATADEVVKRLKEAGVTVLRYDALTGSIYLKLDYGVANSIRIADHPGKPHLNYRYNITAGIPEAYSQMDTYQRYFWPLEQADLCVDTILAERAAKMGRFGDNYRQFMEQNKHDHSGQKGFWRTARLV